MTERDEQTVLELDAGPHRIVVTESVDGRCWFRPVGSPRPWVDELTGLCSTFRTDPTCGEPHWLLAGLCRPEDGVEVEVASVIVTDVPGGRQVVSPIRGLWLLALPPGTGDARAVLTFVGADGAEIWPPKRLAPLASRLGSNPDDSPGGGGWLSYGASPGSEGG